MIKLITTTTTLKVTHGMWGERVTALLKIGQSNFVNSCVCLCVGVWGCAWHDMESVSESHAPSWHIKVHNDVYIARRTSIQSLLDYLIWIDRRYHSRKRTVGNTEAIHTEQYRLNIWISFTSSVASRMSPVEQHFVFNLAAIMRG